MYKSTTSKIAPLSPRDYHAEDSHARELVQVFEAHWQLAGLASTVSQPGQFLTTTIGREPVLVRNFDGELVAVRNVCAHRHCTLATAALGQSERLKCPFHGWEYGSDGRTRRIPAAKNFPDFDREQHRLTTFETTCCGDLVFVRGQPGGPSLQEFIGDDAIFEKIAAWTDPKDWRPTPPRQLAFAANWKIPVEASLESYHIPEVHPQTFVEDPGEQKSDHAFFPGGSSFFTSFNTPRLRDQFLKVYERFLMGVLGVPFTAKYEHHHVFPNLLVSHTDSLTLVQSVDPASPVSSCSRVWHFGRRSARRNPVSLITANLWGRFTSWLSFQVLKEDIRMYPQIQLGTQSARDHAVLGRCEERLAAFQTFIAEAIR